MIGGIMIVVGLAAIAGAFPTGALSLTFQDRGLGKLSKRLAGCGFVLVVVGVML